MSLLRLSADQIVETFAVPDSTFSLAIETPSGELVEVRMKRLTSYGALRALEREGSAWYRSLPKPHSDSAAKWAHPIPANAEEAMAAFTIHRLVEDPPFTLSQAVAIQKAPWFVSAVMQAIDQASHVASAVVLSGQVEQAKKDSKATTPDESPSPSPETSGESTSTP